MTAIEQRQLVSVEDYLAMEASSPLKHEYLGGEVVAMAGCSVTHNIIAGNIFGELRSMLRGGPCRAHISDIKLRLDFARDTTFYYPDVLVTCSPRDNEHLFVREPSVIFEVLSPDTQRIDRQEKRFAYQQIATLQDYVLVAQDFVEVTVYRRRLGWSGEVLTRLDEALELPSLQQRLPLASIYEGVTFAAPPSRP